MMDITPGHDHTWLDGCGMDDQGKRFYGLATMPRRGEEWRMVAILKIWRGYRYK
jgi:hypothetical protein